jgi:hypothetical protein
LLANFEQKMSTKSSKIACSGKNSILKGDRFAIASCAEEEEELHVQEGPGMNEVSFRARPHHSVHSTLGVDTGATGPRWRVDSIEGDRIERGGGEIGRVR